MYSERETERLLGLHRAGRLDDAISCYRRLLAEQPLNPNVLGLLAMAVLQEGDPSQAEELWRAALAADPPQPVLARDLNNLVATLIEQGRTADAVAVSESASVPVWRGEAVPDPRLMRSILSLAQAFEDLGLDARALALVDSVSPWLEEMSGADLLAFRLRLKASDVESVRGQVEAAVERSDVGALARMWDVATAFERFDVAGEIANRLLSMAPVFPAQRPSGVRRLVLVLNKSAVSGDMSSLFELHYNGNYPLQIAERLADEFDFLSVLADRPDGREAAKSLQPLVVINNVVNAELLRSWDPAETETFCAFVDGFGPNVINSPRAAAAVTRQSLAERLKTVPGLIVPACLRFIVARDRAGELADWLIARLRLPLILRTTYAQRGFGMKRCDARDELEAVLHGLDGEELYAHDFIENRTRDGLYRKIRCAVVGDAFVPVRVDFAPHWMVHGRIPPERQAFYRDNPRLLAEERRILLEPNEVLSPGVMERLADIRRHLTLDVFGIDFDVMQDGRVLFFEANANMLLLAYPCEPDVRHPVEADDRLLAAMRRRLRA